MSVGKVSTWSGGSAFEGDGGLVPPVVDGPQARLKY